jgi:hypothetical protein
MAQGMDGEGRGLNLIMNIDVEKAFNRLDKGFLFPVLKRFGFNQNFLEIIKGYIEDVDISLIIKGTSTNFFTSGHGLK